jgi:hypothetical protein
MANSSVTIVGNPKILKDTTLLVDLKPLQVTLLITHPLQPETAQALTQMVSSVWHGSTRLKHIFNYNENPSLPQPIPRPQPMLAVDFKANRRFGNIIYPGLSAQQVFIEGIIPALQLICNLRPEQFPFCFH